MLNKIKKNVLPMLDTLGDALTQYLAQPMDELLGGITQFVDAINVSVQGESEEALALSEQLKASLTNPVIAEVERFYNEYCTIIENLPVQYKVVFLPYYDNTWDSLASVYEAFAADPIFVTEIVIIPIRRNTPTGWKIVYEDYLTPQGIPNTPFSSYSFENDLPDFVFYNNPYDGVNIEKFQSHVIKPYVGCMVYVPYFLYRHEFQNKQRLEAEIEQYTHLSGHDNADVFVVQGKSFLKTFAHRSQNGKKMVCLGNPKIDNLYTHMGSYPRYPEWDKVTQGKTIFMLNTHYTTVINGSYQNFLPTVLDFFERNDDLALIWRPHPQSFLILGENAESSYCIEWKRCLERVNNHERMILDRTASGTSALMYSDAVLSQSSSIVAEAIFADKPIFLLSRNPLELIPPFVWGDKTESDIKKLERIRKYDVRNLFLFSAVCYRGVEDTLPEEEITHEYILKASMLHFIDDIRSGIDRKKELRAIFREQLFVNRDGTCGRKIHDYIVSNSLN